MRRAEDVADHSRGKSQGGWCCPHVETASGILLPDEPCAPSPMRRTRWALLVLDCIGIRRAMARWIWKKPAWTMLISRAAKGWSSSPCCAMVILSPARPSTARKTPASLRFEEVDAQIAEGYEGPARLSHHHAHRMRCCACAT